MGMETKVSSLTRINEPKKQHPIPKKLSLLIQEFKRKLQSLTMEKERDTRGKLMNNKRAKNKLLQMYHHKN